MRVAIVQESLRHYRVPFYEALRERLAHDGIELELYVGRPTEAELAKQDTAEITWAKQITNHRLGLGTRRLVWQTGLRELRDADVVIVEQASRMLLNYVLLGWRRLGGPRVSLWGHGRNLASAEASPMAEAIKKFFSTKADWWFAYNDLTVRIVEQLGFPRSRITSVMNTIDTSELVSWQRGFTRDELTAATAAVGLQGANVGVFVGSLYPAKRLDLLVAAGTRVREKLPDFELLIIGAGSEVEFVRSAVVSHPWLRYVGPKRGIELARLVAASNVMLVPAAVGLVVVDAFALQTPIITCSDLDHGPEVDYIEHGENGWLVAGGSSNNLITDYADAIVTVLSDDSLRQRLANGCRRSTETYTLANMVTRFAEGVHEVLRL